MEIQRRWSHISAFNSASTGLSVGLWTGDTGPELLPLLQTPDKSRDVSFLPDTCEDQLSLHVTQDGTSAPVGRVTKILPKPKPVIPKPQLHIPER